MLYNIITRMRALTNSLSVNFNESNKIIRNGAREREKELPGIYLHKNFEL